LLPVILSIVPPTTATYDTLLDWYLAFGLGASVIVITLLAIFMVRYRSKGEKGPAPAHKPEGWKIVLVTVLISISVLTAAEYQTFASFGNIEIPNQCAQVPDTCVYINVLAFQWGWNFTYPSGTYYIDKLVVPFNQTVVLNITSRDVFHSFGISILAVKEDAIPGRVNQLWFEVPNGTQVPINAIRCYELCGIGHAFMWANLTAVSTSTWNSLMSMNQSQFSTYVGGLQ